MSKLYRTITVFETKDGKTFDTEKSAQEWGEWLEDVDAANLLLTEGANLLNVLNRAGARHPFNLRGHEDADDQVLAQITKNTGLVIQHWQCSSAPGYKVIDLVSNGRLFVHGDTGCWSGTYGSLVPIDDLVRYFRDTLKLAGATA